MSVSSNAPVPSFARTHVCSLETSPLADALAWLAFQERNCGQRLDGQEAPISKLTVELRDFGQRTTDFTLTHERIPGQELQGRGREGWNLILGKLAAMSDRNTV